MDRAVGGDTTLILAPAGFGKTTLVASWTGANELPVAWLTLDEGDNDPARFLSYFATALNETKGSGSAIGKGALAIFPGTAGHPVHEGKGDDGED